MIWSECNTIDSRICPFKALVAFGKDGETKCEPHKCQRPAKAKCSQVRDEEKSTAKDSCDHFAEAVSGAYWPQKGVMAAKEEDIKDDIPETIKC